MIIEIKEEDKTILEKTLLKIAEYNQITYGFDLRADIKCNNSDKNVSFKLNGIRF